MRGAMGDLALVGNAGQGGASTDLRLPFLLVEGQGDLDLYAHDNLATYADGRPMPASRVVPAEPLPKIRAAGQAAGLARGFQAIDARRVEAKVLANAGARPGTATRSTGASSRRCAPGLAG